MAITSAFQADDVGSTPITRSRSRQDMFGVNRLRCCGCWVVTVCYGVFAHIAQ